MHVFNALFMLSISYPIVFIVSFRLSMLLSTTPLPNLHTEQLVSKYTA